MLNVLVVIYCWISVQEDFCASTPSSPSSLWEWKVLSVRALRLEKILYVTVRFLKEVSGSCCILLRHEHELTKHY